MMSHLNEHIVLYEHKFGLAKGLLLAGVIHTIRNSTCTTYAIDVSLTSIKLWSVWHHKFTLKKPYSGIVEPVLSLKHVAIVATSLKQ